MKNETDSIEDSAIVEHDKSKNLYVWQRKQ